MSQAQTAVYNALASIKGVSAEVPPTASLTRDLGLESIDVVDLFFEIEQSTGIVVELNQLIGHMRGPAGRRFEEVTIQDLVDYLRAHAK
jgi:acyl carrier protein